MKNVVLNIEGMTCSACSYGLEKYILKQDGIKSADVNLVLSTLKIEYDENKLDIDKLNKLVDEAGFKSLGEEYNIKKRKPEKLLLILFTIFTIFLMYISMGHMIGLPIFDFFNMKINPINYSICLAFITFLFFIYGFDIIKNGINNIVHRVPNMDSLIALGVIINYLYSCYNMILVFKGNYENLHHLYFEASAMTILFVKIGRFIDKNNRIKATEAIKGLVEITPKKANRIRDGIEEIISIDEIVKGDILICRPGEKLAADGIIIKGNTNVDESFITGESKSVSKHIGDEVIAGSINYNGYIEYEAIKIGRDSNISNIVRMVVEATNSKIGIQRFADRVSGVFVPIIFIIAILSGILNYFIIKDIYFAINAFVTVLVVACPCALGIATPLAMVISIGKLSRSGIFIKSSETLEVVRNIDNIVFDKTGTLTNGNFTIVDKKIDKENMFILQNIESNSNHPISYSICKYSDFNKIEVNNFREISGYGLQGDFEDITYYVGSSKFVKEQCVHNPYIDDELKFSKNGYTIVYLFTKEGVLGIIGLSDTIKSGVRELIDDLKNLNKNLYMLTGDNGISAGIIANELGIDNVISDVTPEQKLEFIKNLNKKNSVMMIGDRNQ